MVRKVTTSTVSKPVGVTIVPPKVKFPFALKVCAPLKVMLGLNAFKPPELLVTPAVTVKALPETVYPLPVNEIEWTDRLDISFTGLSAAPDTPEGKMMSLPVVGTRFSNQFVAVFQL